MQYAKKSHRFEVVHAYLAQHCFFLPLLHVPIRIQNATGTSVKTQDPSLRKGNTGSQTVDYGLLPTGLDSYASVAVELNRLMAGHK